MGIMRFLVSKGIRFPDGSLEKIYVSGMEEVPWPSHAYWDDDLLIVERNVNDSGSVHCPWPCEQQGEILLSTGCLRERARPYSLEVELARGTIHQIRNQLASWETVGLVVPNEVHSRLKDALNSFVHAATLQHKVEVAAKFSRQAIITINEVSSLLSDLYIEQTLTARRRESARLNTLLGVNLGPSQLELQTGKIVTQTFNTAIIPTTWRRIQKDEALYNWSRVDQQMDWCEENHLKICGGPLLQFDEQDVPDWLHLWSSDFENLLVFMTDYVKTVVTRYRGRVHLWQVAARINMAATPFLSEQQKMQTVARAIETTRQLDPRTPVIVSLEQPWGEYMVGEDRELHPLHFADALVRAELGLAGLGLEINATYHPGGTWPRSLLSYSRQLDRWSMFGLPLLLILTTPSASNEETPSEGVSQETTTRRQTAGILAELGLQTQCDWVRRYVRLMLSKNYVQAILWNQLRDTDPQKFPHGGLFDHHGMAKPTLDELRAVRKEYLS